MGKLIIGVGIPGSGKTTVLKTFAQKYDYAYICPDDIREELTGNFADQSKNREVWIEAKKRMAEKFREGKAVVFDATFANPEQRKEFLSFARENGSEKIEGIFLDVPLELAKERNRNREESVPEYVLERMAKSIRDFPPEIGDGFDSIFTLNKEQKLIDAEMLRENKIIRKEFGKPR